ncbi:hypothetical protein [Cellulomonas sp. SG140]|uniref:hypothetical protein n=1 Tax=Cellulomonas sp. SG140 TaxID=2976536 RepID=UPI0021E83744|nr:hypothetical protein [Cellulomonas sp. SG140]
MTTPEATKRARANKRKGASWQSDIRNALRAGRYDVEILELSGKEDEGDLVVRLGGGKYIVIEAKNEARIDIPGYLREAQVEGDNFADHRPGVERTDVQRIAVVKARGKGIEDAYVIERFSQRFPDIAA